MLYQIQQKANILSERGTPQGIPPYNYPMCMKRGTTHTRRNNHVLKKTWIPTLATTTTKRHQSTQDVRMCTEESLKKLQYEIYAIQIIKK